MPKQVAASAIIEASIRGIANAQKDFEAWSGGDWLWRAPEYLSTVYVARELARLDGAKYVVLENSAKLALAEAGATAPGPLHSCIRANGRFDLLMFWGNATPRVPIELKCYVRKYSDIAADVQRLEKVVHRGRAKSTIQFGMVAFFSSTMDSRTWTAAEKVGKWLENIEREAKDKASLPTSMKLHARRVTTVNNSAWTAAALVIKPKAH